MRWHPFFNDPIPTCAPLLHLCSRPLSGRRPPSAHGGRGCCGCPGRSRADLFAGAHQVYPAAGAKSLTLVLVFSARRLVGPLSLMTCLTSGLWHIPHFSLPPFLLPTAGRGRAQFGVAEGPDDSRRGPAPRFLLGFPGRGVEVGHRARRRRRPRHPRSVQGAQGESSRGEVSLMIPRLTIPRLFWLRACVG